MIRQRAFTLVELSIVLVILGLLIGGVLTGQTLIRAAELRAITTEYQRYYTAQQTFRDKYFALPGDMVNATSYWGAQDGSTGTTAGCNVESSSALTCNGNGDGFISYSTPSYTNEIYRYWQHMANAGLIEGSYTGATDSTRGCSASLFCSGLGRNVPKSKAGTTGWTAFGFNAPVAAGHSQWFEGNYGNTLMHGTLSAYTSAPALKSEEAYNIDTKIDDGKPAVGRVRSWNHTFHPNCADVDTLSAVYQLNINTVGCALIFSSN